MENKHNALLLRYEDYAFSFGCLILTQIFLSIRRENKEKNLKIS
jgi:hypothetical protein